MKKTVNWQSLFRRMTGKEKVKPQKEARKPPKTQKSKAKIREERDAEKSPFSSQCP
jgi:hypothetical protein